MPFDVAELAPGLTVARTGFTGDLGYELWTPAEKALALWDRLWASGHNYGLRPIGYAALDLARIEAGFVVCGTDFKSARSEEHTSELQPLMRISYAVFCLKKQQYQYKTTTDTPISHTR